MKSFIQINSRNFSFFFFKDFVCLFERERMRETAHERGEGQREKQTPCRAGSPMRDSIPGLQDHDLSRRQSLNQLSHPGALYIFFIQVHAKLQI